MTKSDIIKTIIGVPVIILYIWAFSVMVMI